MKPTHTHTPEFLALERAFLALLEVNGFEIKPWQMADLLAAIVGAPGAVRVTRMFKHGTVHGLLELTPTAVNLIAIHNDRRGNGHFVRALGHLESAAASHDLTFRVVHFWNKRLADWFLRRGYLLTESQEFGLHATLHADDGLNGMQPHASSPDRDFTQVG